MKHMRKQLVLFLGLMVTSGLLAREPVNSPFRKDTMHNRKVRSFERTVLINGTPGEVFAFMDNIENTGMHMTESSGAMMGSKLTIQWLSGHKTGLGTKYRWTGKVVGMKMDFTVEVTKWDQGKQKVWGTVGDAQMIVIDWFEMYLIMIPQSDGKVLAQLGIHYTKHRGLWGFLLGKWYSKWCVKSMLKDTRKHFEK